MSGSLVIWCGPIFVAGKSPYAGGDVGKVDWLGTSVTFISLPCNNPSPTLCASLHGMYADAQGRVLPNLLAKNNAGSPSDYDHIALCGYSAGHNFMNPTLLSDGDQIDAMVSIDACYSTTNPPWTKAGYVDFGTKAARGEKLMVLMATGSSHGGTGYPSSSGSECALANFDAAAAAAGVSPAVIDSGLQYPPTNSERAGGLFLLDYELQKFSGQLPHFDAVNKISQDVFQTYLAPFLAGQPLPGGPAVAPGGTIEGEASSDSTVPLLLGVVALGTLLLYLKTRK